MIKCKNISQKKKMPGWRKKRQIEGVDFIYA
jgi:hypothetical protein